MSDALRLAKMLAECGAAEQAASFCTQGPFGPSGSRVVIKSGEEDPLLRQSLEDGKPRDGVGSNEMITPPEPAEYDDTNDHRQQPEYTINYKQHVATEDMFLQMGNKTPATASCETMMMYVLLPGETLDTTTVDIQARHVDVRAEAWRLSTYLPHPVREREAKASWDTQYSRLVLELPISRELDVLNF